MNILDKILEDKKNELILKKKILPINYLKKSPIFNRECISLKKSLTKSASGIIAEHKRRSPSKNNINNSLSLINVIKGYENAGACGISVLTNTKFFGGSIEDLILARETTNLPILRKEFIIDEYQITESKANGADAILLIASILNNKEIKHLSNFAKNLGLEILIEVHNLEEIEKSILPNIDLIGINNRNLKTFDVNIERSKKLAKMIPEKYLKISESGIEKTTSILELKSYGFSGFLIGEKFMKTNDPGKATSEFIKKIENET